MATWTTTGLQIDGVTDIREKLNQAGRKRFKNLLKDGEELRVDDASVIGRQYGIIAEMFASLEEVVFDGFMNLDPTQATGLQLDDALSISTFKREKATGSTVPIIFHGVVNTVLNLGASVKSGVTGDVFQTSENIFFQPTSCNGFVGSITDISPTLKYSIEYSVQGQTSNNAPISLVPTVSETKSAFLDRLVRTIVQQTSDLEAQVVGENSFSVNNKDRLKVCSFTVRNITIDSTYNLSWCKGVTGDEGVQDSFTVNIINGGANQNWISATNPYFSFGRLEDETDDEFRNRWKYYKSYFSYGNYDAIISGLKSINDVSFVNIQANTTRDSSGELINKGIYIVVLGGESSEVAQAIFEKLPVGTLTNGNDSGMAVDIYGNQHLIRFSRPVYLNIEINIKIKTQPNFPQNGLNQIRQQLIDYFNNLEVGEDVLYSRLYNPINNVTGFSVNELTVGVSGSALGQQNISVNYNEIASVSADNITIEMV